MYLYTAIWIGICTLLHQNVKCAGANQQAQGMGGAPSSASLLLVEGKPPTGMYNFM